MQSSQQQWAIPTSARVCMAQILSIVDAAVMGSSSVPAQLGAAGLRSTPASAHHSAGTTAMADAEQQEANTSGEAVKPKSPEETAAARKAQIKARQVTADRFSTLPALPATLLAFVGFWAGFWVFSGDILGCLGRGGHPC